MNILIVGSILNDVYLNLDSRTEQFETDKHGVKWLDLGFNTSEHHFFHQNTSLGGSAVTLEVLTKLGLTATISHSDLKFTPDGPVFTTPVESSRYILVSDGGISYLVPSAFQATTFDPPAEAVDYLYIDRSALLDSTAIAKISAYLDLSPNTKLILYLKSPHQPPLTSLLPRADLIFCESTRDNSEFKQALTSIDSTKLIFLSEHEFSCQNITEPISINRADMLTHLSIYSIASATILGGFILGNSVENSLRLARANVEHTKLNSTLSLTSLQEIITNPAPTNDLELIAASLLVPHKGILAADESGGSIHKKFDQLSIEDTYDNRRDYRNIFFSTPGIENYLSGVILFDETARQRADNGQTFTDYLIGKRIIPGIKVDQGLVNFYNSLETYTNGLDNLDHRLAEYYQMGLRFAKWRSAFEIRTNQRGEILTPTTHAITENCRILAEYASKCQSAGIVPIVEPEVVYDGYYSIDQSAEVTGWVLDALFEALNSHQVNLRACILKTNMVIAGKNYEHASTPDEVGVKTAETLKSHVPADLAGIVFLSGGQTPEQATDNLSAILKHGPFPWPITFSFARALQDPALYAWQGNNANTEEAQTAFKNRLEANANALGPTNS